MSCSQPNLGIWPLGVNGLWRFLLGLCFVLEIIRPTTGLRPLRERVHSWGEEWFVRKDGTDLDLFSAWNLTGTYRGSWRLLDSTNNSSRFPNFKRSDGSSIIELISTPTKITGVHYVQGLIIFHDVFDNEHDSSGTQIRVEGVYIWPFKQLRLVVNSAKDGDFSLEDDYILTNRYQLIQEQENETEATKRVVSGDGKSYKRQGQLTVFSTQVSGERREVMDNGLNGDTVFDELQPSAMVDGL